MKSQEIKKFTNHIPPASSLRIFVGLSGGVDSSVSAALLKKQGCEVVGVFIKIWSSEWIGCTSKEDRLDAMRVCAHLDIPFREIDLTEEYKKEVVDRMIREYKMGRTPNPDVMCNQKIKFGAFFDWAITEGADFVATGHYAKIAKLVTYNAKRKGKKQRLSPQRLQVIRYMLQVARDSEKDQSYFLWTLTQKQLARTLFPIGHLTKPEVRKLAKKFGLPTAKKKDSQGLCFVGPVDVKEFLKQYIKTRRGDVLNTKGKVIGWHDGASLFTLGERHGFIITKKTTNDFPYYVVVKDVRRNTITVSEIPRKEKDFLVHEVALSNINWISGNVLHDGTQCLARYRYRQPLQSGCFSLQSSVFRFNTPQPAVPVGQSLVLYKGGECLGGGIIENLR